MLHFGGDFGRAGDKRGGVGENMSGTGLSGRLAADPSLMQLLPLAALRAEAVAAGLTAHRAEGSGRIPAVLRQAEVLREIARRTGEADTLARAASAALRARDLAGAEPHKIDKRAKAAALIAHAEVLRLGAVLFGDDEAAGTASALADAASILPLDPAALGRLAALRAGLQARAALDGRPTGADPEAGGSQSPVGESDPAPAAETALHAAAEALDGLARLRRIDPSAAHEVHCDRVELALAVAIRTKDRVRLDAALATLEALAPSLDMAYRPLTWARAQTLRGQALAALGDLLGDAGALTRAAAALHEVVDEIPADHSPLDAARAGHAHGLALQALGEACDEDALYDRAIAAFAPALEALDLATALPLRSVVAHDGAVCLARRAERRGDLPALERAEAAFRDALKSRSAAADPLSWAVTQMALARIYEAEADLRGDTGERADAAFALASALEVFSERGLRSLSDVALQALDRVKASAV